MCVSCGEVPVPALMQDADRQWCRLAACMSAHNRGLRRAQERAARAPAAVEHERVHDSVGADA